MTRYTTKHFWRMTESDNGEWVRYEDLIKGYDAYQKSVEHIWKLYLKEANKVERLNARIVALFSIVMGTAAYAIAKLIGWSLGL